MLRRILLIAQKEGRHILRDWRTLYLAFGIPFVLLWLFGYALTTDIEHIPLVVIDGDRSADSRALVTAFTVSGVFTIVARPDNAADLERYFRQNRAKAGLVIMPGLARDLGRGSATVQLVLDGTDANVAAIAMGYAAGIAQSKSIALASRTLAARGLGAASRPKPPLEVRVRNWFNPALRSQWYLVPGLISLIMAMMGTMLMALTVAREYERGTMEQLLVTPVHPAEIIVGKLLPYFLIGLGQLLLVTATGLLLFDVPLRGSVALLAALSSVFLVGVLAQGLLISVATRSQQVAVQLSMISSMLPALLLSGFMSPIASMPEVIQWLTRVLPARYFLVILRGVFLKGVSLPQLWGSALALAVFAVVLLTIATRAFKTRLD